MGSLKNINDVDTNKLLKEINETDTSIIIAGCEGTGKSYVLNKVIEQNNNQTFMVNGTLKMGEYLLLVDYNLYDLYHICLIIKKMLEYIKINYLQEYLRSFSMFEHMIDKILLRINSIYLTGLYKNAKNLVDSETYEYPECLLEKFLNLLLNNLNIANVFLIIDDFDKVGGSSELYQKLIYNKIKKYMNVVMAISDKNVVNSEENLNKFAKDNNVIKLEYTKEIEIVSNILDEEIASYLNKRGVIKEQFHTRLLLGDEVIALMIEKTNGNLFDMLWAIRHFYNHINELTKEEYASFVLDYIDNEINKNPIISGRIIPKRTLFIKE